MEKWTVESLNYYRHIKISKKDGKKILDGK